MKTIIIFLGLTCLLCVHTNAQSPDHQLGRGKSTPSYHLGKSKSAKKSNNSSTLATPPKSKIIIIEDFHAAISKLEKLGWERSTLYKHYYEVGTRLIEEGSETSYKALEETNDVIIKIFNNQVSKDIIEKELVAATKNSESPLEVFLAYY